MLNLWSVMIRHLELQGIKHRGEFSVQVATVSSHQRDAVALARSLYTEIWWRDNIIVDVTPIGRLAAAEGLEVPVDRD